MAQKSAMMTRRIRFLKTAEDGVTYEIISTTNGIHIDQEGNVTPLRLTARAYMRKGAERTPLTTNDNGTESEYCLLLSMAEGQSLLPAAGTSTAIFKMSSSSVARIDLVRGPLLGKAGSSNSYVYSEDHILATLPVLIQRDGQDGDSAYFTSIVFKRSDTLLTSADTPVGGTYLSPVPPGWSDAPPAGNAALWMSRARITPEMDGEAGSPTPQWSVPSPVADQSGIEYIFSHKESPGEPANTHPYPTDPTAAGDWGKDPTDAIWMGVALKNNGIWGEWALVRIKGETGPTGPAAEWHEIALSAESVYIKGIQTEPQSVTATVWKVIGGVRTQLTHLQMAASAMQIVCTVYQKNGTEQKFYSGISGGVSGGIGGIGGTTSSLHSLSVLASNFIGATRVEFSVTKGLTETVCVKALLLQIAGEDGDDGEDGLMMPPPRRWEDYPEGYLFQSGQPGDERIDTVVYSDDNGRYLSARCRVRHTKSALHHPKTDNTALKTVAQNPYWTAQDGTYELVATNVLLAANAYIELLSSQFIRIYNASREIVGQFSAVQASPQSSGIRLPFFVGGVMNSDGTFANPTGPLFAVDTNGRAYFGGTSGQRIEMDPLTKAMLVYDSDGTLCAKHHGDDLSVAAITASTAGGTKTSIGIGTISDSAAAHASSPELSKTYQKTVTQGTAASAGVLRISVPALSMSVNTGPAPSNPDPNVPAQLFENSTVNLSIVAESGSGMKVSKNLGYLVAAYGQAETAPTAATELDLPLSKGETYRVYMSAYLVAGGTGAYAQYSNTTAGSYQLLERGLFAEYGRNGLYFRSGNNNYFYVIADGATGKLRVKAVSDGTVVFESS